MSLSLPGTSWAFVLALAVLVTAEAEPRRRCCGGGGGGALVAASLGFVGGLIAGHYHHHHHHHHGGGGCGGCGGGCGWCGGGYGHGYGRRRRSLADEFENEVIEDIYTKITEMDTDQCGLRLVCELAQKAPSDLALDETQILLPYFGEGESDGSSFGSYDEAAWHGQRGHDCHARYALCPWAARDLMGGLRKFRANTTLEQAVSSK
ncbi:uncharacterized protein LOC143030969 [Oratosquilla oratoria]|uniref:uncharacterized protein LOC143030969 n=1 Tax=Oratosquilla oratoria TaxID=337810 RepID=UPI003F7632D2